jgi:hypothetical protein
VEFVKAFIAQIISSDRLMYVEEEDMPSKARSAGLCEELGQVWGSATVSLYAMRTCFSFIRSHPALKLRVFPGQLHLFGQNRDADTESDGVQEVQHRWRRVWPRLLRGWLLELVAPACILENNRSSLKLGDSPDNLLTSQGVMVPSTCVSPSPACYPLDKRSKRSARSGEQLAIIQYSVVLSLD